MAIRKWVRALFCPIKQPEGSPSSCTCSLHSKREKGGLLPSRSKFRRVNKSEISNPTSIWTTPSSSRSDSTLPPSVLGQWSMSEQELFLGSRTYTSSGVAPFFLVPPAVPSAPAPARLSPPSQNIARPLQTTSQALPSQFRIKRKPVPHPSRSTARRDSTLSSRNTYMSHRRPVIAGQEMMLTPPQVREAIDFVGRAFSHIPHVVCGLSALVYHGYTARLPSSLTVICSVESQQVIRGWALTCGMQRLRSDPDSFGLVLSDEHRYRIQFRYVESSVEDIDSVPAEVPSRTRVSTLASIAEELAEQYVRRLATADRDEQSTYCQDIRWTLSTMQSRGEMFISPQGKSLLEREFWLPFTLSFPDTIPLFAHVGLEASEDVSTHSSLTCHDDDFTYISRYLDLYDLDTPGEASFSQSSVPYPEDVPSPLVIRPGQSSTSGSSSARVVSAFSAADDDSTSDSSIQASEDFSVSYEYRSPQSHSETTTAPQPLSQWIPLRRKQASQSMRSDFSHDLDRIKAAMRS